MAPAPPLGDRSEDFLQAPVAALMFVMASRDRFNLDQVVDPATACVLASAALSQLNPWTGNAVATRSAALDAARTPAVSALMREVLNDPRVAWWSAPLDRDRQLQLLGRAEQGGDPLAIPVPTGPIDSWENYAQKTLRRIVTTTELAVGEDEGVRSSGHAELAIGSSDWAPEYPIEQRLLQVAADARVFEVHSAGDWHDLVRRYGDLQTFGGSDSSLLNSSGITNGLAPTWSAVADDYDGVHLSFAGLLTAVHAPVTSDTIGTTTLWAWDYESTYWIRPVFTGATDLPAILEPPDSVFDPRVW